MLYEYRRTQINNKRWMESFAKRSTRGFLEIGHFVADHAFAYTLSLGNARVHKSQCSHKRSVVSLPRHLGDQSWYTAAWNQTLCEHTDFIKNARNHKPAPICQRFQCPSRDVFGRLVDEAKLSMAVSGFSCVRNSSRAECDHADSMRP